MNIFIFSNSYNDDTVFYAKKTVDILAEMNFTIYMDEKDRSKYNPNNITFKNLNEVIDIIDYIIAIGGDGTILKSVKCTYKNHTKIVGINTGRLGFMSSIEKNELSNLTKLQNRDYHVSKRIMITGNINEDEKHEFNALNDIVIYNNKSKMSEFHVYANDEIVGRYRANGIIFSTPTGSTAYALSAGGPIIHPELECIEMALICPHSLFARPLIFSADTVIQVKSLDRDEKSIAISSDGDDPATILNKDILTIKKSKYYVELIDLHGSRFFKTLNTKLMQPLK